MKQQPKFCQLINLLGGSRDIKPEKCFVLAELLKEKADIYADLGKMDKGFNLYRKSFNVYVEVLLLSKSSYIEPNYSTIDQIINKLKPFQVPYETQKLLFRY